MLILQKSIEFYYISDPISHYTADDRRLCMVYPSIPRIEADALETPKERDVTMVWGFVTCGPNEALVISGENITERSCSYPRMYGRNVEKRGHKIGK